MAELADAVDLKTVVSLPNELSLLVYVRTLAAKNDHSDAHTVNMVSTIALLMRSKCESFCACRCAASYRRFTRRPMDVDSRSAFAILSAAPARNVAA